MGIICNILQDKAAKRSTTSNPSQWLIDWVRGGTGSSSGVTVSEDSALKYTPFWGAVRTISGTLGSLPFFVYKRLREGGKERVPEHRVYELIHDRPNPYMDIVTFLESRQAQVLCYGNSYAEIQRDGGGRPVALWPLLPNMTERKIDDNNVPYYEVKMVEGGTVRLADDNVLHIKGLGFDGYTGYNVVQYHREAIGYGVAVKEYGSRFFGNNASPGGILEHPGNLSTEAQKRLKASWEADSGGLSNAHRLKILEEGMKWTKIGVDPEQAQALEVQKYTVDDCARIFNIPPHKLASMEHATFSNIEEQNIDFVTSTMAYWFRKWETELNYKLFNERERKKLFCEVLADALLRGNTASRYEAYNVGRMAGFLCVDDIREKENMNPLPDGKGKIFLEPLNMKEAGEPDPDPDQGSNSSDDAREMLRELISEQLERVITKRIRTEDKYKTIEWSQKVLTAPVRAYAVVLGVPATVSDAVLTQFLRTEPISETTAADELTERLTKLLTGDCDG